MCVWEYRKFTLGTDRRRRRCRASIDASHHPRHRNSRRRRSTQFSKSHRRKNLHSLSLSFMHASKQASSIADAWTSALLVGGSAPNATIRIGTWFRRRQVKIWRHYWYLASGSPLDRPFFEESGSLTLTLTHTTRCVQGRNQWVASVVLNRMESNALHRHGSRRNHHPRDRLVLPQGRVLFWYASFFIPGSWPLNMGVGIGSESRLDGWSGCLVPWRLSLNGWPWGALAVDIIHMKLYDNGLCLVSLTWTSQAGDARDWKAMRFWSTGLKQAHFGCVGDVVRRSVEHFPCRLLPSFVSWPRSVAQDFEFAGHIFGIEEALKWWPCARRLCCTWCFYNAVLSLGHASLASSYRLNAKKSSRRRFSTADLWLGFSRSLEMEKSTSSQADHCLLITIRPTSLPHM